MIQKLLIVYVTCFYFSLCYSQEAIHNVATDGNLDPVKKLLKANPAMLNIKDKKGLTPLHSCQSVFDDKSTGSSKITPILIEKKALLNEKNKDGLTPFGLAQKKGITEMIRILKEAGAE